MALGLAFVVIAGEIDISVASILAVSVVCFSQLYDAGLNVWLALLAGLAVATALGCINGVLVGIFDLPSLAITLGTLAAYSGLAYVILPGEGVAAFPEGVTKFGGGYVDIQYPIALFVLIGFAVALGFILHATRFGRYLYTIGSNREAGRFAGVPVARVRVTVFAISGFMAGIAGVVYVGYFGSARADAGQGSLLDVVTAVVLGGVDIFGGSGSILGVFLALSSLPSCATACSSRTSPATRRTSSSAFCSSRRSSSATSPARSGTWSSLDPASKGVIGRRRFRQTSHRPRTSRRKEGRNE